MSPDAKIVTAGVEEADRLNLEAFIEATDLGKVTYEACGFVYAGTNYLESAKRDASQKWRELETFMEYVLKFIFAFWCPITLYLHFVITIVLLMFIMMSKLALVHDGFFCLHCGETTSCVYVVMWIASRLSSGYKL